MLIDTHAHLYFDAFRDDLDDVLARARDAGIQAIINIAPFRVSGRSVTKPGARRAALYEAEKTYRNYHPSHRIPSPYPDEFTDQDGTKWTRVKASQRADLGDYAFLLDGEDEEDYADIEQMLQWDVRVDKEAEGAE